MKYNTLPTLTPVADDGRTAPWDGLFLFEFMDQPWVPQSLRRTLREILECGNSVPFRSYYQWVAHEVTEFATEHRIENIVELGAGTAPITKLLAKEPRLNGVRLTVCDNNPDVGAYRTLEKNHPEKVCAVYEPVDFSRPRSWPPSTLLVLSATLHHIPFRNRSEILSALTQGRNQVMVFEPLRRTPLSIAFVFFSIVPALSLPIWYLKKPGRLRRLVWCWLVPLAPLIFWWDGIVSCLRQWTDDQWQDSLDKVLGGDKRKPVVEHWIFTQLVRW